jgi:feruloyl-CoA synthase
MASSLQMGALLVSPREAPVQVEWLPWHHTMGSNVILHGILKHGGTLYIDEGRPVPQLFHKTIANLKEVSPTAMFNVPAGYTLLCEALETDQDLRTNFFRQLDRMSYAGAAISRTTLDKLYHLAKGATGKHIPVMSGYGATETAPTIATTHWATDTPGELGLPAPGVELKLIPAGDTYEARVRGPNVTPGYLGRPDLTSAAFDDEGFYRVGDTVSFIDPANPSLGLRFTGRVSENFQARERDMGGGRQSARSGAGGYAWCPAGRRHCRRKSSILRRAGLVESGHGKKARRQCRRQSQSRPGCDRVSPAVPPALQRRCRKQRAHLCLYTA